MKLARNPHNTRVCRLIVPKKLELKRHAKITNIIVSDRCGF